MLNYEKYIRYYVYKKLGFEVILSLKLRGAFRTTSNAILSDLDSIALKLRTEFQKMESEIKIQDELSVICNKQFAYKQMLLCLESLDKALVEYKELIKFLDRPTIHTVEKILQSRVAEITEDLLEIDN